MQRRQNLAVSNKKGKIMLKGISNGPIPFSREPVVMIFKIQNRYSISVI
jgi:hypothetical protein